MVIKPICKTFFLLPLFLSATTLYALDASPPSGAYCSLSVGKAITDPSQWNLNTSSEIKITLLSSYKRGTNLRAALGYQAGNFRYELEPLHLRSRYKLVKAKNNVPLSMPFQTGFTRTTAAMSNIYYEFNPTKHWTVPYLGGGIGVARIKNQLRLQENGITSQKKLKSHAFTYQAIAGVKFNLTKQAAILLDYRYFASSLVKNWGSHLKNHSLNAGLFYRF